MQNDLKSKGTGKANIDLPVSRFAKGKYIIKVYDDQKIIGTVLSYLACNFFSIATNIVSAFLSYPFKTIHTD